MRGLKRALRARCCAAVIRRPFPAIAAGVLAIVCAALLCSRGSGRSSSPTLDEKNIVMEVMRIPSTSLTQSQTMQLDQRARSSASFRRSRSCSRAAARPRSPADPMPPSATDTFIILKPRAEWPDPDLPKDSLIRDIADAGRQDPRQQDRVLAADPDALQRADRRRARGPRGEGVRRRVRADAAGRATRSRRCSEGIRGADEVKVEDVTGMPVLDIRVDKAELARHGLNVAEVQDAIGIAVGGRPAGFVFEGDRRFQIVVRLADIERNNIDILKNLPVPLPGTAAARRGGRSARRRCRCACSPTSTSPKGRTRSAARTASGGSSSRRRPRARHRLVRRRGAGEGRPEGEPAAGILARPGAASSRTFAAARQRLVDRGADLLRPDLRAAGVGARIGAGCAARVHRACRSRSPAASRRCGCAACRSRSPSAVGFIALSGVAVLNGLVMLTFIRQLVQEGVPLRRGDLPRRADAAAAGADDGARRLARLRADGDRHRHRRRGAEAARHRRDRRAAERDAAHARRAAGALCAFRRQGGTKRKAAAAVGPGSGGIAPAGGRSGRGCEMSRRRRHASVFGCVLRSCRPIRCPGPLPSEAERPGFGGCAPPPWGSCATRNQSLLGSRLLGSCPRRRAEVQVRSERIRVRFCCRGTDGEFRSMLAHEVHGNVPAAPMAWTMMGCASA